MKLLYKKSLLKKYEAVKAKLSKISILQKQRLIFLQLLLENLHIQTWYALYPRELMSV